MQTEAARKRAFDGAQRAWEDRLPDDEDGSLGEDGEPLSPEQVQRIRDEDAEQAAYDRWCDANDSLVT